MIKYPKVRLLAVSQINHQELAEFLNDKAPSFVVDSKNDPDVLPEIAGRVCYMSFSNPRPGGNKAYLGHIIEAEHGSVLEHVQWTFIVENISRACSHELVRHRHLSFSQLSQRYVSHELAQFTPPPAVAQSQYLLQAWLAAIDKIHNAYKEFLNVLKDYPLPAPDAAKTTQRKYLLQTARSLLPNATCTSMVVSGNTRAWRHVIELRCSPHADAEIRSVCNQIFRLISEKAPNSLQDYSTEQLPDGTFIVLTKHKKV